MCRGNSKRDVTTMVTYSHATTPLGQSERAYYLSYFINNNRADGNWYSFARIERSWTFGNPYFSFQKQILFTIISTLSKNEHKINVGS